jgi:23S rRNA-/tRNA-specific pseudouridylate synthase
MAESTDIQIKDLPLNEGVDILASNEDGLVALNKPAGAMSHPNTPEDIERSLLTTSYDYEKEYFFWKDQAGDEKRVWLINRLDSPTSGVILLGLNEEIAKIVKHQFSTRKVTKTYFALVRHVPQKNAGSWVDMIDKNLVNAGRVIKKGRQIRAKTAFQLVKRPTGGFPVALLKLNPITGRTHQLRVQCKKHGHPIVGDRTYGNFSFNKEVYLETGERRMMLHSAETILTYAFKGKVCSFRAKSELPEPFNAVLRFRPGMAPARAARADSAEEKKNTLEGRRFKEA